MSFPKIAYDTTAAIAAGMAGLGRPSGGVSDRRSEPGGEGHDAQGVDVAAVRVDGRPCGGIAATVDGRSWVWPLWSKKESNPDLATCKTRSGMEVT